MFRIHKIIMGQFGYFEGVVVPLEQETTVLTGGNGTGKSTSYDAVRLALGSHKYANEKRRLDDYVKDNAIAIVGIVATNRRRDGKPGAFRRLGYKSDLVTVARVYTPKSQGRESRFVLADRELTGDEILSAVEGKDWLTEGRFQERLHTIGINAKVLDQLIIRQSKVTEIINKSPRDLYETVLHHAGTTEVVRGYYDVRKDSDTAAKALQDREDEFKIGARELGRLEEEATKLTDFEEKEAQIVSITLKAEASKASRLLLRKKRAEDELANINLDELNERFKREHAEEQELRESVETLSKYLENWDEGTKKLNEELKEIEGRLEELREKSAALVNAKTELKTLQRLPPTARLGELAKTARDSWAAARIEGEKAQQRADETTERLKALREGRTAWPHSVAKTLTALGQQKIPYECLAHWVDPTPATKPLVEAALGSRRFAISVPPSRLTDALRIAKANQFPGPVFPDGAADGPSTDSVLRPRRAIPEWLSGFEVNEGSLRSREGFWVTPAADLVLGPKPTENEVRAAGQEADRLTTAAGEANAKAEELNTSAMAAEAERQRGIRRDEFVGLVRKGIGVKDAETLLEGQRRDLDWSLRERKDGKKPAREKLEQAKREHKNAETKANKTAASIHQKEEEQQKWKGIIDEVSPNLEGTLNLLPKDLRLRVEDPTEVFEDEKLLRNAAEKRQRELATLVKPDPEVRNQRDRYKENVRRQKELVGKANEQLRAHLKTLEDARKQYAVFASSHLGVYEKRLRSVAHQFGVNVAVTFTSITNKSSDAEIDNAQLEVRFGYKKTATLVSGGGFSGGEDVINALMLQLALQDFDEDGFIMIDQPYDHLDAVNTRTVAEYLAKSHLQVIIALPSDTKPDMFRGMVRGILFHKAPEGKPWAHPPEIIGVRTP